MNIARFRPLELRGAGGYNLPPGRATSKRFVAGSQLVRRSNRHARKSGGMNEFARDEGIVISTLESRLI